MADTSLLQVRTSTEDREKTSAISIYSVEEAVNEVRATMAFEDMNLTEEDVQMLYAYMNGKVSEDELRQEILGGAK